MGRRSNRTTANDRRTEAILANRDFGTPIPLRKKFPVYAVGSKPMQSMLLKESAKVAAVSDYTPPASAVIKGAGKIGLKAAIGLAAVAVGLGALAVNRIRKSRQKRKSRR